jgi:hypothetical protein
MATMNDAAAALQLAITSPTSANCKDAAQAIASVTYKKVMKRLAEAGVINETLSDEDKAYIEALTGFVPAVEVVPVNPEEAP